jgi:hypothetical protein
MEAKSTWRLFRHKSFLDAKTRETVFVPATLHPESRQKQAFLHPQIKTRKPNGSKNQKTHRGVSSKREADFSNIQLKDLFDLIRCEALYFQAVRRGPISDCDASALNFLSAGVRARSVKKGHPCRILASLIRRRLWSHITSGQEDFARRVLSRARTLNPNGFRLIPRVKNFDPRGEAKGDCAHRACPYRCGEEGRF